MKETRKRITQIIEHSARFMAILPAPWFVGYIENETENSHAGIHKNLNG